MKRRFEVGDKVGRLIVIQYLSKDTAGKRLVRCMCECGATDVIVRLNNLGRKTNSCGCLKADLIKQNMGKPIEDLAARHVLNACKRHTENTDLTLDAVKKMIFSKCFYCEEPPETVGTIWKRPVDDGRRVKKIGIDRIDNQRGYYSDNVMPCCKVCNYIKRDHNPDKLAHRLMKFIKNLKKLHVYDAQ